MKFLKLTVLFCIASIILAGCSSQTTGKGVKNPIQSTSSKKAPQSILYKNKNVGLTLYQTGQWRIVTDKSSSKGTNVVFKENKIQAIVSIVSSKNSISSIKKDLLKSVRNPTTLSESNTSLDFESGTKEKMRITSTFKMKGNYIYIFSFVTPVDQYDSQKSVVQAFMDKVVIN